MNTPTVGQMKGFVDTSAGLLDRQIFFSQEITNRRWRNFCALLALPGSRIARSPIRTIPRYVHGGRSGIAVSRSRREGYGPS